MPDKGPKLLQQLLEIIHKNPNITTGTLLEYWREQDKLYQRLSQLAVLEREERMRGNEEAELQDCMKQLLRQAQTLRLDYLRLKDKQSGQKLTATEKSEYQQLLLLAKQKPRKAEKS